MLMNLRIVPKWLDSSPESCWRCRFLTGLGQKPLRQLGFGGEFHISCAFSFNTVWVIWFPGEIKKTGTPEIVLNMFLQFSCLTSDSVFREHIKKQNNHACLQIKDNGVGFKEKAHQGFGLKGMTERGSKLDGDLSILSSSGTEININIPLVELTWSIYW